MIFCQLFFALSINLIVKSLAQTTTTEVRPSRNTDPPLPPSPPSATPDQKSTDTTAWSLEWTTPTPKNSTVGSNPGTTFKPDEVYGFEIKRTKRCQHDAYLFPFRYITEPMVCADWCQRDSSCLGFMVSLYSGACEAFTKCIEVDDEGWVVYYRQAIPTTTRLWAGTSPSPDNFIDLTQTTSITSVLPQIQSHFAQFGNVLQTVVSAANGSRTANVGPNEMIFPMTRLTVSQSIVVSRTLESAWKSRIIFNYQPVEGWIMQVPPPDPAAPETNTAPPPGSGRRFKCNQGTVDAACKLLKLNNQGMLFLLPWLWEGFHNKSLPASPVPDSVAPLNTIVTLCYGEQPPTYTNELVCPDPAMLNAIGALAISLFERYSLPLYVAAIIGSPVYEDEEGSPSITHFYGSGVDVLCGVAIYGAKERLFDESCRLLVQLLRKPEHGGATPCDDVYLPAREANVGCGMPWWPIPGVHCDKTILGNKRK